MSIIKSNTVKGTADVPVVNNEGRFVFSREGDSNFETNSIVDPLARVDARPRIQVDFVPNPWFNPSGGEILNHRLYHESRAVPTNATANSTTGYYDVVRYFRFEVVQGSTSLTYQYKITLVYQYIGQASLGGDNWRLSDKNQSEVYLVDQPNNQLVNYANQVYPMEPII